VNEAGSGERGMEGNGWKGRKGEWAVEGLREAWGREALPQTKFFPLHH